MVYWAQSTNLLTNSHSLPLFKILAWLFLISCIIIIIYKKRKELQSQLFAWHSSSWWCTHQTKLGWRILTKYRTKSFSEDSFWIFAVTLTVKIAMESLYMTLQCMTTHHNTNLLQNVKWSRRYCPDKAWRLDTLAYGEMNRTQYFQFPPLSPFKLRYARGVGWSYKTKLAYYKQGEVSVVL